MPTLPVEIENGTEVWPAATVTVEVPTRFGAREDTFTAMPPAGAVPESVIVPFAFEPPIMDDLFN